MTDDSEKIIIKILNELNDLNSKIILIKIIKNLTRNMFSRLTRNLIVLEDYLSTYYKDQKEQFDINNIKNEYFNDPKMNLEHYIDISLLKLFEDNYSFNDYINYYMNYDFEKESYKKKFISRLKNEIYLWKHPQKKQQSQRKQNQRKQIPREELEYENKNFNNRKYSNKISPMKQKLSKKEKQLEHLARIQDLNYYNQHLRENKLNRNTLNILLNGIKGNSATSIECITNFWDTFLEKMKNKFPIKRGKLKILCQLYIIKLCTEKSFSDIYFLYNSVRSKLPEKLNEYIYNYDLYDVSKNILALHLKNIFDDFLEDEKFDSFKDIHKQNCTVKLNTLNLLTAIIKNMKNEFKDEHLSNLINDFNKYFGTNHELIGDELISSSSKSNSSENFHYKNELEISKMLNTKYGKYFKNKLNKNFIHEYIY